MTLDRRAKIEEQGNVLCRDHKEKLTAVRINLTDAEWCSLAMRDGKDYVGGCCGNMSLLQDIINDTFRANGFLEMHLLLEIGELAREHDGFPTFAPLSDHEFNNYFNDYNNLNPWDKIGLIYNSLEDALLLSSPNIPKHYDLEETSDAIYVLNNSLAQFNWRSIFTPPEEETATHQATLLTYKAKILPVAMQLVENLQEDQEEFSGYALTSDNQVLSNNYGLCLYDNLAKAQRILGLTLKSRSNYDTEEIKINHVTVSMTNGLQIGKQIAADT